MKRNILKIFILILLIHAAVFLSSCNQREFEYLGEYPQLYTAGAYSLLGMVGHVPNHHIGAVGWQPYIKIYEEDDYGRVLFSYGEDFAHGYREGNKGYLIIQKFDNEFVYFYPYYSFILSQFYKDDEIDLLKNANNWNQPLYDDGFEKLKIVRQKEAGPIPNKQLIDVYYEIFPEPNLSSRRYAPSRMEFLRTDAYGRSIYSAGNNITYGNIEIIIVLFHADHSFDLDTGSLTITDMNNYQTELRSLMETNGWNTPP